VILTPKRALLVGFVLIAIGGVWLGARNLRHDEGAPAPASVDDGTALSAGAPMTIRFFRDPKPAAAFALHTIDNQEISLASLRGKVTIVNFWATWCPPCRAEIPDLIALQEKYRDRLQIVGISEDEGGPEVVRKYVAEHHMNYPVAMTSPEFEKLFPGVSALPTSFLIDTEGRIVQKHVGMLTASLTEAETRALAGLAVNATIEQVEQTQKLELGANAQALEIPGVDLAKLTPAKRTQALEKLNGQSCTCGCDLTVARCRVDDPTCGISLPLARQIVDRVAAER
jgi:thiol-disulfide isomerase/thioredoxin